jgi:hypothetical protein
MPATILLSVYEPCTMVNWDSSEVDRQADFQKKWHSLTAVTRRIQIEIAPRYLSGVLRTEHNTE